MNPEWRGRLEQWDATKDRGWLRWREKRLPFQGRNFHGAVRLLKPGVRVRFEVGLDEQGRPCAKNVSLTRDYGAGMLGSLLLLGLLLVLPAAAVDRAGLAFLPWKAVACAYVVLISIITYAVYDADKQRARIQAWRISESTLHLLEVMGGWPGAWLGQRLLRHKSAKKSYQLVFWNIIMLHQFLAWDALHDWHYGGALLARIREHRVIQQFEPFLRQH
jgi:uncharacterized membrane protein YsdA (DUF1294 family)